MKILAIPGVIDLKSRMGCVAQWWALLKAMHEIGHDIIVIPYYSDDIESPWWKTYPNPCVTESKIANWYLDKTGTRGVKTNNTQFVIDWYIKPKWEKTLFKVIEKEKADLVLFMTLPVKHFQGIPDLIRKKFGIPIVFYDGDLPSSLPVYAVKSFKFGTYGNPGEFDLIISNSEGCIEELIKLGAKKVKVLQYAADPSVFSPVNSTHEYADIFYYGHRLAGKENRFRYMVIEPSKKLECRFVVGGRENGNDLGNCERRGVLSLSEWRTEACNSKINVNVTKEIHANVYASSNARIFELAMLGCAVVSDEYKGLENWFDLGSEMIMVKNYEEALYQYKRLLTSQSLRLAIGERARHRALKCHTFQERAKELENIVKAI